ncbi:vitamin K epoxide reductase complex subunit 1-like protein 1 [Haliotis rubra]|uniref:vitamin K epoxide reductase complex subunit 1-like protein 1 n=1 Tax=Haliotis rubra TaxID=36100 RepID=UPI001EE60B27|nr:vitamin K epoxide reductase complex subunit 1-like protein 1 [Haliotis rubra]
MAAKRKAHDVSSPWIRNSILLLCSLGIVISGYAYHVEMSKEKDDSYRALCDFSETISCSKVFTSRWGRGFGLIDRIVGRESLLNQPNSVFGMIFYAFQVTIAYNPTSFGAVVQLVSSMIANVGSIYLAYILFFVLKDVCIVCMSMYVINFLLLLCSISKLRQAMAAQSRKQR